MRSSSMWTCQCLTERGNGSTRAEDVYGRRFRAYAKWRSDMDPDEEAAAWRFYRFVLARVKVLDETKSGPGIFVVGSVNRLS